MTLGSKIVRAMLTGISGNPEPLPGLDRIVLFDEEGNPMEPERLMSDKDSWAIKAATLDPEAQIWKIPSKVNGMLTALSPSTVASGTSPRFIAISSDGKHVYVANNSGNTVSQYSRDLVTGALTPLSPATVAVGTAPSGIRVSPDGANVYVVNTTSGTVSQFARDSVTGLLTALGSPTVAVGSSPRNLRVSPDGLHVYVTNFNDDTISQLSRGAGGALTALGTPTVATGDGPQGIEISPDGLNVYSTDFTANTIRQYSRNPTTGLLTAISSPLACTTGPYGLAISPDGYNLYCVTFSNSLIYTFNRSKIDGSLTNVYGSQAQGGGSPHAVAVSPDGRTVYAPGSVSTAVAIFSRNADGPLSPHIQPTFTVGTNPRQLVISPDGKHVYVVNSSDATVSQASVNMDGGIDVTPDHTIYPIAGYDTLIGMVGGPYPNARFEIRRANGLNEQPFPHTPDMRVVDRQYASGYLAVDPELVSEHANPEFLFRQRMAKIVNGDLVKQIRSIPLVRGTANGSYATRIDGTRRHFDIGVRPSSNGIAISNTQWVAQQFDFPIDAPVDTVIPVEVNLVGVSGGVGDIQVDIVAEVTGLPGSTVVGTAIIDDSEIPAIGEDVDDCWVLKNITLTQEIRPINRVWVRLKGLGAGVAANWRAARGQQANASIIAQGLETQYYRAAVSTDSGATFTTAAVPAHQGLYSLRIIPEDLPDFIVCHVTQFQSFFTVIVDGPTRTAINIWDESNDSGGGAVQLRYSYEPWLPWRLSNAMHFGAYKIAPEVGAANPESQSTIIVAEIPTDGSW